MTIKEFYEAIGDSFEDVLDCFGKEDIAKRFALKFKDDPSFQQLAKSMFDHDFEGAFRAVHTLKGVVANLNFTKLYNASRELTEILRAKNYANAAQSYENLKIQYNKVINLIGLVK